MPFWSSLFCGKCYSRSFFTPCLAMSLYLSTAFAESFGSIVFKQADLNFWKKLKAKKFESVIKKTQLKIGFGINIGKFPVNVWTKKWHEDSTVIWYYTSLIRCYDKLKKSILFLFINEWPDWPFQLRLTEWQIDSAKPLFKAAAFRTKSWRMGLSAYTTCQMCRSCTLDFECEWFNKQKWSNMDLEHLTKLCVRMKGFIFPANASAPVWIRYISSSYPTIILTQSLNAGQILRHAVSATWGKLILS